MIEISDLHKYYGARRAVGPVSASIEHGEIVGLLGLNGAGKTTTLRILACDLLPSSGTVRIDGIDVVERPDEVRSRIGYLPDSPPLYDEMTVHEYLVYAAKLRGVATGDVAKYVEEVQGLVGIKDVEHEPIASLSHGYRKRVGIAQAIVHKPKLVVLDEPISGLDPVQIVEMRDVVRRLGGEHTVLVSSHILSEISETCDRILVIRDGEVVASGTEEELASRMTAGLSVTVKLVPVVDADPEALKGALCAVTGVASVDVDVDDAEWTVDVEGTVDIRTAVAKAVIDAGYGLLELRASGELEDVFLSLIGGAAAGEASASISRGNDPEDAAEPDSADASEATDDETKEDSP